MDLHDLLFLKALLGDASGGGGGGGLTEDMKQALLACFEHVAWVDQDGQEYYDALEEALYPSRALSGITAVYSQSGTIYTTDSLNDLKNDLLITANYNDGTSATVASSAYTLSGTLVAGTSTITASYNGKTAVFNVTVTAPAVTLSSISAVFTQSGTVYDSDSLDDLKADLVVTATYSDSSTATVPSTDYTLSGTLTVGTSTITVSYAGKTTTFTVTVTKTPEVGLVYENPTTLVFNRTQAAMVDTGYDVGDDPFTIAVEWDSWSWPASNYDSEVLFSVWKASQNSGNNVFVAANNGGWGSQSEFGMVSYSHGSATTNFTGKKAVVTCSGNLTKPVWYYKNTNGELVTHGTSNNPFSGTTSNVWIGGRVKSTDGLTADAFAEAEITIFKIYNILWREEKIKEFLGVEES